MRSLLKWLGFGTLAFVAIAIILSLFNATNYSANAAARTARAHEIAARANHVRRLLWQKTHPKEYAEQKAAARLRIAQTAERHRIQLAEEAERNAREQQHAKAVAAQYAAEHAHDGCDGAMYYSRAAVDAENSNSHQAAYDAAVAGLSRVNSCDDSDIPSIEGRLLGSKALSEHHLSSGDSETDLNQAVTLLARCQSEPGYYGEHSGASCETEEETLISYKTHWEMDAEN